jgi:tRNA nucleotidyltransferase (CCA-adding enzyme)
LNLGELIYERLPSWLVERIITIGDAVEDKGWRVFVVGGFVRDLLLGRRNFELDVMVEGEGIYLAKVLSRLFGAKMISHEQFMTAVLYMPDGTRIDIATCRKERYKHPAALPEVEPATAEEDLYRRDFSINAMAIDISKERFGELLDVCGGLPDLESGLIRVLHERSFIDDPTRVFRAVRFEKRFSFSIESNTMRLLKEAIECGMLSLLTPDRIKHEWIRICSEENPQPHILRMEELDMLRWIDSSLSFRSQEQRLALSSIVSVEERLAGSNVSYERWLLYLMPLLDGATNEDIERLCRRYSISSRHLQAFLQLSSLDDVLERTRAKLSPSSLKRLLDRFNTEALIYALAKAISFGESHEMAKEQLLAYLEKYRHERPDISGSDIIGAGIPAGPWIGTALDEALKVKLDEGADRQRQLEVALKTARKALAMMEHGSQRRDTCSWEG